jgi:hypothetical protein
MFTDRFKLLVPLAIRFIPIAFDLLLDNDVDNTYMGEFFLYVLAHTRSFIGRDRKILFDVVISSLDKKGTGIIKITDYFKRERGDENNGGDGEKEGKKSGDNNSGGNRNINAWRVDAQAPRLLSLLAIVNYEIQYIHSVISFLLISLTHTRVLVRTEVCVCVFILLMEEKISFFLYINFYSGF